MLYRALVMSGGGSKGAFQAGALDTLVKHTKLDFHVIAGVSAGSLNAVIIAQGNGLDGLNEQVKELSNIWLGFRSRADICTKRFLGKALVFIYKDSIFDPAPLKEKIRNSVSPDQLRRSGKQLRVGAVRLETGDYRVLDEKNDAICDWVLASSSMPLMFPPVVVEGEHAVDGGVRNVTPLREAFQALKTVSKGSPETPEMYVLLASPLSIPHAKSDWKTGRKIGMRAISIMVNEIFREDLEYALAINRSVRAHDELTQTLHQRALPHVAQLLQRFPFKQPKYRQVRILGVVPDEEYSEDLEVDPKKISKAFTAGQEAAKQPLDEGQLEDRLKRSR